MEMDGGISAEAGPILLTAPSSAADKNSGQTRAAEGRLASLDFFRGLAIWLLFLDQLPSAVVSSAISPSLPVSRPPMRLLAPTKPATNAVAGS